MCQFSAGDIFTNLHWYLPDITFHTPEYNIITLEHFKVPLFNEINQKYQLNGLLVVFQGYIMVVRALRRCLSWLHSLVPAAIISITSCFASGCMSFHLKENPPVSLYNDNSTNLNPFSIFIGPPGANENPFHAVYCLPNMDGPTSKPVDKHLCSSLELIFFSLERYRSI